MTGTFEGVGSLQFTPDNKWCYAYSGDIPASGASVEYLTFKTNSEYIVGILQFNGTVNDANITAGTISGCTIKLNGSVIATLKADTLQEDSPSIVTQKLLLPPNSHLQVSVIADTDDANSQGSLIFIGKVSGAIEQENLESISDNNKWASL